jgi:hypothetical protein
MSLGVFPHKRLRRAGWFLKGKQLGRVNKLRLLQVFLTIQR